MRSALDPSERTRMRARDASVNFSNVESEVHDVGFLDDVLLALETEFAGIARPRLASPGDVVREGDHLGADEAALEVGMNDSRCLWRSGADAHGPGAHLFGPCREERFQPEQRVRGADDPVEPGLGEAKFGEEHRALAVIE